MTNAGPAEPGGQGGRGPPKDFQNQYSGGLSSTLASEGILALAPQIFLPSAGPDIVHSRQHLVHFEGHLVLLYVCTMCFYCNIYSFN